jgi:hypothetical protein
MVFFIFKFKKLIIFSESFLRINRKIGFILKDKKNIEK